MTSHSGCDRRMCPGAVADWCSRRKAQHTRLERPCRCAHDARHDLHVRLTGWRLARFAGKAAGRQARFMVTTLVIGLIGTGMLWLTGWLLDVGIPASVGGVLALVAIGVLGFSVLYLALWVPKAARDAVEEGLPVAGAEKTTLTSARRSGQCSACGSAAARAAGTPTRPPTSVRPGRG